MSHHRSGGRRARLAVAIVGVGVLVAAGTAIIGPATAQTPAIPIQSLDGSGNNVANPSWGRVGSNYARVGPTRYADGVGAQVAGPNSRNVSNRIFNDVNQNLFSERRVTQWGFTWGQFLDHTFGLRQAPGVGNSPDPSSQNIAFNPNDPLETFTNDLGEIPFTRSSIAPGTGTGAGNPRQQVNTLSSYIDAFSVYSGSPQRLEWLREGPVDNNLANNSARLLLPGNLLPRRDSRGNAAAAPVMDVDGRLRANPNRAMVAGDVRANENIALTATHTLFAREHNRIVGLLPTSLTQEQRFQIARRIVIAEQQYITYNEFLPAMGVKLPRYTGYNPNVNATLTNEFATVGYRAHSQIHGEIEMETEAARYSAATLASLEAQGVEVAVAGDEIELAVPLNVAFFNPDLVPQLQLGPILQGIGLESEYKNDEQIDNQLRSVLFQVPVSGNPECLDGPGLPECFRGVVDLGAIDIERGRDHGMPSYNQLRAAYGLPTRSSFGAITGDSETFPSDPQLTPGNEANDPDSLDFLQLFDIHHRAVDLADEVAVEGTAVFSQRRTPLAARLRAVYGNVNNVDAFTGMVAEPHQVGTEFGELQLAIWTREFRNLRDGDRFFYGNDPGLSFIRNTYGIDYRRTLAQVIASNTDIPASELNPNVFFVTSEVPPGTCRVRYTVASQWSGAFEAAVTVTNVGATPVDGWTLAWTFANGQRVTQLWNGIPLQGTSNVSVTNQHYNDTIGAGGGSVQFGFIGSWNNATNAIPTSFTLNNTPCSIG